MSKITEISARQILDSREKPTLEVEIVTDDGIMATDSVPSGTSTGSFEAVAIPPQVAVENINNIIKPKILGMDVENQQEIDQAMIDLDGTKDKSRLGANAILGVSLAVARAGSLTSKKPLFLYLNHLYSKILKEDVEPAIPTPIMVMIEGGKHGKNNLCIQEFSVICPFDTGKKIWTSLRKVLVDKGLNDTVGLEGGFAPQLKYDEDALDLIVKAVSNEKLEIGKDVELGLDIAGGHCQISHDDILEMFDRFNIYALEDPVSEDDWAHWAQLKEELERKGKKYLLIGDDLFVTSKERLQKGIKDLAANGIIIKLNQVGSVTETLEVVATAKKAGYTHILSHRSGETMDTFIADLAVATAAKFIKAGAPFASERVAKYNRILEIEKEL